jgi:hypothetical protein
MPRNYQMKWDPAVAASLAIGANSLTWREIFTGTSSLPSNAIDVPSGAIVLAWAGMGWMADLSAPTDNQSNTYTPLLPAHNYEGWMQSGQRLYAATGVTGSAGLVVTEAMPQINDEVTLSVVVVTGGTTIAQSIVIETTPGPAAPSVTVSGPALLVSSWWGDGGLVQGSVTPSAGWTLLHELSSAQAGGGVLQTAAAYRVVASAGTYTCTWTANDGQGAVAYIVAVQ